MVNDWTKNQWPPHFVRLLVTIDQFAGLLLSAGSPHADPSTPCAQGDWVLHLHSKVCKDPFITVFKGHQRHHIKPNKEIRSSSSLPEPKQLLPLHTLHYIHHG